MEEWFKKMVFEEDIKFHYTFTDTYLKNIIINVLFVDGEKLISSVEKSHWKLNISMEII